jgi:ornithine carbamoyltransferase
MCGASLRIAHPEGYGFDETATRVLADAGVTVEFSASPAEAAVGAHAVYTDAWYSMGQEAEMVQRRADFAGFTIDSALMAHARPDAVFLHCLPAHRGDEASDEVLDGPQSRIFPQAHNRLHSARGLMWFLMNEAQNGADS